MSPSPARGLARDTAAVALIVVAWAVFWWPELAHGRLLYIRDLVFHALPAKQYLLERVAAGEWPQWTPRVSAGMPFLADAANQALYPFNALLVLAAPERVITWYGLLHGGVAMLGGYALVRVLGVGAPFALWAGLCYGLSGYVVSITDNLNYLAGAAWLPVALACHLAALRGGRLRPALGAALALAMMLLAGDVLAASVAVAVCALLSIATATGAWRPARQAAPRRVSSPLLAWLAMTACGTLLAAAQVLPTLLLLASTTRAEGVTLVEATQWSLPPARLLELVQPYLFGAKYPALEFLAGDAYPARGTPWAASIHVGLVPVLAAALAAWLRPRQAWPWLLLGVTLAALALGRHTPLYALAHDWLPLFGSHRYPEKLVAGMTLAIVVLAALGAEAAFAGPLSRRLSRPLYLAIAALLVLVVFVLTLWWPVRALLGDDARVSSFFWSELLGIPVSHMQGLAVHAAAVCVVLVGALAVHAWRPGVGFALVAVLALADLGLLNRPAAPGAAAEVLALDRPPAVLSAMPALAGSRVLYESSGALAGPRHHIAAHFDDPRAALAGGIRLLDVVLRSREGLARNEGARFGVDYANGLYSPLQPAAPAFLERVLLAEDPPRFVALTSVDHVLVSVADTRWPASEFTVVHEDRETDLRVLRPLRSPPRAALVPNAVSFAGPVRAGRELIYAIDDFRRRLILDPGEGEVPADADLPLQPGARVTLRRPQPERIVLAVDSPYEQAWLRVDESFSPGWSASVDGEPVPVRRADFRAMAVAVPGGRHEVTLLYRTPGLEPGRWLSQAGVALLLVLAWLDRRRARDAAAA